MRTDTTAREEALSAINEIERGKHSHSVFSSLHERWKGRRRDLSLSLRIAKGVIEWRDKIDLLLGDYIIPSKYRALPSAIRNILRLSAYQLLFLDKVPNYAVVNESVALAKKYGHRGTAGLVNGVLRRLAQDGRERFKRITGADEAEKIAILYSHPLWLVKRWIEEFGKENTEKLCSYNNTTHPPCIRVSGGGDNILWALDEFKKSGVIAKRGRYAKNALYLVSISDKVGSLLALEPFKRGLASFQDESSQIVPAILAPKRGECVLDLCAAPGGKAFIMEELMEREGVLVANEKVERRAQALGELCRKRKSEIVITVKDGAFVTPNDFFEYTAGKLFDKVLVDAPCSGTGTIAKKGEIRWRLSPENITACSQRALALLKNGAALVRKGGYIAYSTCSLEREENWGVVSEFLNENSSFILCPPLGAIPSDLTEGKTLCAYPFRHGIGGAFCALMKRIN
ncbi:MAG: 16S rRNA (cytosine(967)-C(5))-methyltransferase RsmB [Candidatus Dadabacteria bacterium]|nr:MAG: 16S rRNA (cytosine(967)-C(5))-methyltransferase RsmB [Candidatus Dadabacteria bacterium]